MTVKLQSLAIKSELKVAMRYKNFKAVAMRCRNKGKPKYVTKDCVILLKKFLSRYLFLWGHELASSFLLFRLHKFFLQMIINFSKRHKFNSPLDVKRFVIVFECPNVFWQFSFVSLALMSKRCCVVLVMLLKICSKADVCFWWRLCGDCCLVNYILCNAFSVQ